MLYADDIVRLTASLSVLQKTLDIAKNSRKFLLLEFNTRKSLCVAFGPRIHNKLPLLMLGENYIEWHDSINYLGSSS